VRTLWILCLGAALSAAPPPADAPPARAEAEEAAAPADDKIALAPLEQLQNDAITYAQAQAAALSGNYTFRVVRPPLLPRVPGKGALTFEPDHLSRRDLGGIFFASFQMKLDGRPIGMVRVDIEGKWNGILLRAKGPLSRKSILDPDQFEQVPFDGAPPAGALSELPAGYRLRGPVSSGHLLVMQDLETVPVVAAGDPVRLEVVSGALTIALEATARSNGAVGEKVRLEMPTSHKNVQALVTGPGEARLTWAGGN
jgi:flagella basal body P-ring formation protein FlgA